MTTDEIRLSFLNYYKNLGHQIYPSASVLPSSPNLLFTNAGMNSFVPYFTGEELPPCNRITNSQKCIRAGGKHNDLEDVGFDTYHQTFFEMLGTWSFGDYFKKESIHWAWNLLTKEWGFPKERMYATIYKPNENEPAEFDQEAFEIWIDLFKKENLDPKTHIVYGSKKDNFWMMGSTGPCGPCSELHIDLTPNGDTQGKLVNKDHPLCIELCNLVFIQFNSMPRNEMTQLSSKYIDTGMGLERISGVLASTKKFTDFSSPPSNYDGDNFKKIFDVLTCISGHTYSRTIPKNRNNISEIEMKDCAFRILADHVRVLAVSIADGVIPGNEGRNYVLRRIFRRAILFSNKIGLPEYSFLKLIDPVVQNLGGTYPELIENKHTIREVLCQEETTFNRTIKRGLQLLDKIIEDTPKEISGLNAFTLYDTYGFPIDLTKLIAQENGIGVDIEGFNLELEHQRDRSRKGKKESQVFVSKEINTKTSATIFEGYKDHLSNFETKLIDITNDKNTSFFVLKSTPFYAEGGGQIGDVGTLTVDGLVFNVTNTIRDKDIFYHQIEQVIPSRDIVGKKVVCNVDTEHRFETARHHSATHLLQWALREILGETVRQTGSLVTSKFLRFDFSYHKTISPKTLSKIEQLINDRIVSNYQISWSTLPFEAKPKNVLSFFGEKYGALVRMVTIGNFSLELCGGTHVKSTGELGLFKILHQSAVSAGNRRIEAVVGFSALREFQEKLNLVGDLSRYFSCKPQAILGKIKDISDSKKQLDKKIEKMYLEGLNHKADTLLSETKRCGDIEVVLKVTNSESAKELKTLSKTIFSKLDNGLVVLGSTIESKGIIVTHASPSVMEKNLRADEIVKNISAKLGGKGGGKPNFAMGGGPLINRLETSFKVLENNILEALKTNLKDRLSANP